MVTSSLQSNHEVVESLNKFLANSYILMLKTQNYHWNVTGPHFSALHVMFENQYNDLFQAIDVIAERIRALGHRAPGNFTIFSQLATVKEETAAPNANEMLQALAHDHQTLVDSAEAVIKAAQEVDDEGSADLAVNRLREHQKNIWMIKSHLE